MLPKTLDSDAIKVQKVKSAAVRVCVCLSSRSELSSQLALAVAWYVTSLLSPPHLRINSVQLLMNRDTALAY